MDPIKLEIESIGQVIGGRTEPTDDYWGGPSVIRLNPEFPEETLLGLDQFSHLVVLWHFHLATHADVALHARSPRNNPAWPPSGTFAHRNHRRPNQLAQSFPRLIKIEGRDLHVRDLDAVDGTPVFDLAPYFAEMGPRGEVREPAWPREMLVNYWEREL